MKNQLLFFLSSFLSFVASSQNDSTVYYNLPDSIKAYQFLAEINVGTVSGKKEVTAGIRTDVVKLFFEAEKTEKEIVFEFPESASVIAAGLHTDASEKGEIKWNYNWSIHETYKLLIAAATDSAENFSLYSGYIWLPAEKKWKIIGTCKITGRWNMLQGLATFYSAKKNAKIQAKIGQVWCQRTNSSWKNLKNDNHPVPTVNLLSHVDSIAQLNAEIQMIRNAIASGKTDVKENIEGVYYTIMKEGTGRQVTLNDTVTVLYKLTLFQDGSLVEESKDKSSSFPLKRLIRGWQLGVPLCKVGGRIKLVIPSSMGYSIRTRSAKIPPNSILVFEVEVLDAKSP